MQMWRQVGPAMVVTAAAALAFLVLHPRDVFWTTDGGNRFVQVQQLARTGELPIEYPAASLDPDFVLAPTGGHHFVVRDGRLHSFYATAFALVVAPLYRLIGVPGLYVIPVLSMLVAIPLFGALSRRLDGDRWMWLSAFAFVFATPLFFYTVSFWEHTLSLALTAAGILLTLRERPGIGGALVALGAVFREESYIALAAVVLGLAAMRKFREACFFTAAALAVLAPMWIANYVQYNHPLGLHSVVYDAIARETGLAERLSNFWIYLFAYTSRPAVRIGFAIPAILLVMTSPLRASQAVERARVILLYTAAAAACVAAASLAGRPLNEAFTTQSLFGALPFALTFFAVARRLQPFLTVLIVTTVVLTCALLHQGDIGLIWGPRHFLWLIPFLLIATIHAVRLLPPAARPAIALLVMATLAIQIQGVRWLSMKLQFSGETLRAMRASDAEIIATDVFWVPEEMAALWFEKKFLFVKNDQEMEAVVDGLREMGIRRMDFVASGRFNLVSRAGYAPLLRYTTGARRIGDDQPMITEVQILYADLGGSDVVREVER